MNDNDDTRFDIVADEIANLRHELAIANIQIDALIEVITAAGLGDVYKRTFWANMTELQHQQQQEAQQ